MNSIIQGGFKTDSICPVCESNFLTLKSTTGRNRQSEESCDECGYYIYQEGKYIRIKQGKYEISSGSEFNPQKYKLAIQKCKDKLEQNNVT